MYVQLVRIVTKGGIVYVQLVRAEVESLKKATRGGILLLAVLVVVEWYIRSYVVQSVIRVRVQRHRESSTVGFCMEELKWEEYISVLPNKYLNGKNIFSVRFK